MILKKLGDEYKLYSHDSCIATTHESPYKKLSLKNCQAIESGYDLDAFKKSLQQTEWDCTIVTLNDVPVLDADGCLILKRK